MNAAPDFLSMVRTLAAAMPAVTQSQQAQQEFLLGNTLAEVFISTLRQGQEKPDALMSAVALAGKAGESGEVLRGFCQGLQITLEVPA